MPDNKTVITYEVAQALQRLDQLQDKLDELGDKTQSSFKEAEGATTSWEKKLQILSPRLNGLLGDLKTLTAGLTGFQIVAVGAGAAAVAAFAALAAQLIDIPELTKDAAKEFDTFAAGLQKRLDLKLGASGVEQAFASDQLTQRLERIRSQQADIAESQAAVSREREVLKGKLDAQKAYYKQLDAIAKSSAKQRQAIEEQIADIRERRFLRGVDKLPPEFQVNKLLGEATTRRQRGDLEGADRFLQRAQSASDASGGFGARKLAEEENALVAALEKRAAALKATEDGANKAKASAGERVASLERELSVLVRITAELSRQRKELQAQSKRTTLERDDTNEAFGRADAAAKRRAAINELNASQFVQRSALANFQDKALATGSSLFGAGGQAVRDQAQQIIEAKKLRDEIFRGLNQGTPEGDLAQTANVDKLAGMLNKLERNQGTSGAFKFDIENLNATVAGFEKLLAADKEFVGNEGRRNEKLSERVTSDNAGAELNDSTKGVSENLQSAVNRALALEAALQKAGAASRGVQIGGGSVQLAPQAVNRPAFQPITPAAPAAAAPAQEGPRVVNVNATVRGGIIDAETTRTITDLIQRELRKNTAKAPAK